MFCELLVISYGCFLCLWPYYRPFVGNICLICLRVCKHQVEGPGSRGLYKLEDREEKEG